MMLPPDSPSMPAYAASGDTASNSLASWGLDSGEPPLAALTLPGSPSARGSPAASRPVTPSSRPKSPKVPATFDTLQSRLQSISPQKDPARIAQNKRDMNDVQLRLVDAAVKIDAHVDAMHCELLDAVTVFNTCITFEERNTSFELLTAMLGDDCPAREGFLDWRGLGTSGLRPLMLTFFSLVHRLSELRLQLEELETPEGRKVRPGGDVDYDKNRYRWTFMYNGVDVVLKVMHCLDFLRRCREFCNNFGKKFFFTGNPLMMPFDMLKALREIPEMQDKVQEQLSTKAHVRPAYTFGDINSGFLAVSVAPGTDGAAKLAALQVNNWKLEKFLNRFRQDLLEMFKARGFNWPNVPLQQMKDPDYVQRLYTAFLVIFVRQQESVESTYKWEKQFIQLSTTVRGQSLMVGSSGLKPDLQLPLPSSVLLNTKNALLGIFPPAPEPEPEPEEVFKRKRKPAPPPTIRMRAAPGAVGGAHPVREVPKTAAEQALAALFGAQSKIVVAAKKKSGPLVPRTLAEVLAPFKRVEYKKVVRRLASPEAPAPLAAPLAAPPAAAPIDAEGSVMSNKKKGKKGMRLQDVLGDVHVSNVKKALAAAGSESSKVSRASTPTSKMTRRSDASVLLAPLPRK